MKIRLLAFASASDALGAGEMTVELPDGSGLGDLRRLLDGRHPALAPLWPRLAVALDGVVAAADAPLRDGQEVALLPPVSGGAGDAPAEGARLAAVARPRAELVDGPIDAREVLARVAAPERGAVLLFLGTVRDRPRRRAEDGAGGAGVAGEPPGLVLKLTYSAYRPMAMRVLQGIAADLEEEAPGLRVAIVHRLGEVAAGEASVAIAVASPHRAQAYEASRRALERLKAEVPIWKREHFAGGAVVWREEEPLGAAGDRGGSGGEATAAAATGGWRPVKDS